MIRWQSVLGCVPECVCYMCLCLCICLPVCVSCYAGEVHNVPSHLSLARHVQRASAASAVAALFSLSEIESGCQADDRHTAAPLGAIRSSSFS